MIAYVLLISCCVLGVWSIWRPGYAAAVMLSTFAAEQVLQTQFTIFVDRLSLANELMGLIVVIAVLFGRRGNAAIFSLNKVQLAFAALFVYSTISCTWAMKPSRSLELVIESLPYVIGIGFLMPLCIRRIVDVQDFLRATVCFGGLVVLGTIFCERQGYGIAIHYHGKDYSVNYLAVGSYAMIVGITSIATAIWERNSVIRFVAICVSPFSLYALFQSGARGQGLAFIAASMLLFIGLHRFVLRRSISHSAAIIAITVAMAFLIGTQFVKDHKLHSRLQKRWSSKNVWESSAFSSGIEGRIMASKIMLKTYAGRSSAWVLGLGSQSSRQIIGYYCHVVPVEVLCELGLVGLALYASSIWVVCKKAMRVLTSERAPPGIRYAQITLLAVFGALFATFLKQGDVLGLYEFVAFGTLIATVERLAPAIKQGERPDTQLVRPRLRRPQLISS